MVGPKKQDSWAKINILKGNHSILRIRGAPVCQKLGMILENKLVQKLKLSLVLLLISNLTNELRLHQILETCSPQLF